MLSWDYEKVAVVAHGNIIRHFLARFQNKEPKTMWNQEIIPASVTIVKEDSVSYVTEHLKGLKTRETNYVE